MARRLLGRTSVRDALDSAVIALEASGCDTPRLDAELLLAHVLRVGRADLIARPGRELEPDEARAFMDLAARRRAREPVAYILGSKGFRTIDLAVDPRVLIPRPETEHVVEAALSLPEGARVADVGTGSGAIALALKTERPDLRVVATDSSAGALEVARGNAERLGLDVAFVHSDLLEGVDPVDAVVSNPPYVAAADQLPPEIGFEPREALFGGADGLDIVRRLIAEAAAVPFIALEVGAGQAPPAAELMTGRGWRSCATSPGTSGRSWSADESSTTWTTCPPLDHRRGARRGVRPHRPLAQRQLASSARRSSRSSADEASRAVTMCSSRAREPATVRLAAEAEGQRRERDRRVRFDTSELGSAWTAICAYGRPSAPLKRRRPSSLHRRRRRRGLPRRHRLRPRVRPRERGGRRAAVRAEGAADRQAERGDVLRRALAPAALPELGPRTRALMERLLPGGVTLLLPNPRGRCPLAGGEGLGLRVPDVPLLRGARSSSCRAPPTWPAALTRGGSRRCPRRSGRARTSLSTRASCPGRRRRWSTFAASRGGRWRSCAPARSPRVVARPRRRWYRGAHDRTPARLLRAPAGRGRP